jgi:hypothetical protein
MKDTTQRHYATASIAIAFIGIAASEAARRYYNLDPEVAGGFRLIVNLSLVLLSFGLAKLNLSRTPQHQNTALLASFLGGFCCLAAIDQAVSLIK